MLISTEYSGLWYSLFYQLAFAASFSVYLFVCWRKKQPLTNSLLIGISGAIFALIGSKLATFSWQDWQFLWSNFSFPVTGSKSTIGAFVLGSLGLVLAKRFLKHPFSILDNLAYAVPAALIFQRLGCLMAGCCFGHPTLLPWGMRYGNAGIINQYHYQEGLINYPVAASLPVHPIPLYLIIAALLSMLLVFRFEKRFKAPGSLFLFSISILFAFRFFTEFFRAAITNHNLGTFFLGLKLIQWALILFFLINVTLIILNEKRVEQVNDTFPDTKHSFIRSLVFTLLPLGFITLGYGWFDLVELAVLRAAILLLFCLLLWTAFKKLTIPHLRMASSGLLILAIVLMAQYPVKEEKVQKIEKQDNPNVGLITGPATPRKKTQTLTFGYLGRNIDFVYQEGGDCFGPASTHEVGPTIGSVGLDYNHMWYKPSNIGLGFGFGGHYTTFQSRVNGGAMVHNSLGGITGYFQMEIKEIIGFKTGLNLGDFPVINGDNFDSPLLPLLYFRFGPPDRFFLDAGLGNDIPFGFTASFFQMGGGIGLRALDIDNPSRLRMGVTKIADKNALYFSSDIYVKQWLLSPTVRVSEQSPPNFGLKIGVNLAKQD